MAKVTRELALPLLFWALVVPVLAQAADLKAPTVEFDRDIRQILSENCFACHGPDPKARKAKLRLDIHDGLLRPDKPDDAVVIPGDPAKSKLVYRITTTDPDDHMPPPESGKKLKPQQIDLLTQWIAQGAPWQKHWAYVAPQRPPLPEINHKDWPRNEIDPFVLARLEKEKLRPAPEATRSTLIRRVTFDLTGLPPTPQAVDAYLADNSSDAYEKVVDRLLASPRYGEQMARYWLDAARYADSHGFHIDSVRSIWKYREWVIQAFNENKPFDQFSIEQLAGDLLPNPTTEQKIASGYVRCNMSTSEGGAIVDEYQAKYTFDRTETMATTWMGMTLTCARCHSHKFDPITHREYYRLFAFFNSLDESVMDGNRPDPAPSIRLPSAEQSARLDWLKQHLADAQAQLEAPVAELDQAQAAWQEKWQRELSGSWRALPPHYVQSNAKDGAQLRALEDQSILAFGSNPEQDVYEFRTFLDAGPLAGLRLETLPHDSMPQKAAGRADDGRFRLSEIEAVLIAPGADGKPGKPQKLQFKHAAADTFENKFEAANAIDGKADTGWGVAAGEVNVPHAAVFLLGDAVQVPANAELRVHLRFEASKSKRALGHFRLAAAQNEKLVQLINPVRADAWQVIGPFKTEGLDAGYAKEYPPEQEIDFQKSYPGVREEIRWHGEKDYVDGKNHLLVDQLHGVHGAYYLHRKLKLPEARQLQLTLRADTLFKLWVNGKLAGERAAPEQSGEGPLTVTVKLNAGDNEVLVKVVNHQGACYFSFASEVDDPDSIPPTIAALLATGRPLSAAQLAPVRDYFRRQNSPEFRKLFTQVGHWREEEADIEKAIPTTMIAKELAKPRETHLLMRGEYDKPGEVVTPGVPAILPPFPADAPTNRLGLAKWLLNPKHPLTARVTVNRFWQQFFGVGIVKTAEDFGVQGEPPSHPELLDWLATEFVRTAWDVKKLQRLIVTSATYRQSSKAALELHERDPENRLLARGPRFRLDAEEIRDTALAVSGLLVEQLGGQSVKPYEPPGLWEAVSFNNSQKYVPDLGAAQYRRSMYTFWKRQSPPPNMLLFDAPTREYCVVRRPRTNTPLQALATLNDPQFVEASRAFAQRILREGGDTAESRLRYAFRLATARWPRTAEVRILADTLREHLTEYRQDQAAAKQLLSVGQFQCAPDLDSGELAAWTTIASMLLNLDETVTKG